MHVAQEGKTSCPMKSVTTPGHDWSVHITRQICLSCFFLAQCAPAYADASLRFGFYGGTVAPRTEAPVPRPVFAEAVVVESCQPVGSELGLQCLDLLFVQICCAGASDGAVCDISQRTGWCASVFIIGQVVASRNGGWSSERGFEVWSGGYGSRVACLGGRCRSIRCCIGCRVRCRWLFRLTFGTRCKF
jgi:hypothetical protein